MDLKRHWERVYDTRLPDAVSWYQPDPTVSLRLLDAAGLAADT